ncbi:hypothetical protein [Azohydromonas lata]|uniref:hypothetical protein n=1 Tax=Azohydromonas lata TaxID=45677 RepID=UPI00082C39E3|nr:hypothetical protein [Azohydromonas lata]
MSSPSIPTSAVLVATAAELRVVANEPLCIVLVVAAVLVSLALSVMGAGATHAGPQCSISRTARRQKDEGEGLALVATAAVLDTAEARQF